MKLGFSNGQKFYNVTVNNKDLIIDMDLKFNDVKVIENMGFSPICVLIRAAKNIRLPDEQINLIAPLGENPSDKSPYKFIGPLEDKNFPGFFIIPGFTRYALSKKDILLNRSTGRTHRFNVNGKYYKASILNDMDRPDLLPLHRAKALVFKCYDEFVDNNHVNHKNSLTLDNRIDNLEWCTPGENTRHYHETEKYTNPCECLNLKTGKVYEARNTSEMSKLVGIHSTTIDKYLVRPDFLCTRNFLLFRFKGDEGRKWPKPKEITRLLSIRRNGFKRDVIALNIKTGKKHIWDGLGTAAKNTGIPANTMSNLIDAKQMVPSKNWIFREYLDPSGYDWPCYSKEELVAMYDADRIIKLYKLTDGTKTLIFSSWSSIDLYLGIKIGTARVHNRDKGLVCSRYTVTIKNLR